MKPQTLLALLLLVITGCGCSKKSNSTEETLTCGCEMPNLDKNKKTKNPNEETIIAYNKKDNSPNNPYPDTFVISTNKNGMLFSLYVCNENILPKEVKVLKNTDQKLKVKYYEGFSKDLCNGIIAPTHYIYNHITLTKIELL